MSNDPSDPAPRGQRRNLAGFTGAGYERGRSVVHQALWFATAKLAWQQWWFPARLRPWVLRKFGAQIGDRVLIRHGVRVHLPWKLAVGNDVWIGEDAWIINLEQVSIGDDVCVSQGAMICAGSHDRHSPTFEFDNAPILIERGSWIAARAIVLRGVTVHEGGLVGAGAVASSDVPPGGLVLAISSKRSPSPSSQLV